MQVGAIVEDYHPVPRTQMAPRSRASGTSSHQHYHYHPSVTPTLTTSSKSESLTCCIASRHTRQNLALSLCLFTSLHYHMFSHSHGYHLRPRSPAARTSRITQQRLPAPARRLRPDRALAPAHLSSCHTFPQAAAPGRPAPDHLSPD